MSQSWDHRLSSQREEAKAEGHIFKIRQAYSLPSWQDPVSNTNKNKDTDGIEQASIHQLEDKAILWDPNLKLLKRKHKQTAVRLSSWLTMIWGSNEVICMKRDSGGLIVKSSAILFAFCFEMQRRGKINALIKTCRSRCEIVSEMKSQLPSSDGTLSRFQRNLLHSVL